MRLRLDNIQGNVWPGFRSEFQAYVLVRFPSGRAARQWLASVASEVTSAEAVRRFLDARQRPGRAGAARFATWRNLAFSWQGLKQLGAPHLAAFPEAFRSGMYGRVQQIGDDPRNLATWEVGGTPETEAHALLLLAAGRDEDLERELNRQQAGLLAAGVVQDQIKVYCGARLQGKLRSHEQFGFRDGVSQPVPVTRETRALRDSAGEQVEAGEFILGYRDEHGQAYATPSWTRDGSYLVFRRFRQHVAEFRRTVDREARRANLSPELLAAKLVGRWRSGAKLELHPPADDPGWRGERAAQVTRRDYALDPTGLRFPRFAHIRKAYPRDVLSDEPQRHRMLRRGIPYGPPLPAGVLEDDGQDRGLLFLAYQTDLARQFEHVQRGWLDNVKFPVACDGPDPLVGQVAGPRQVKIRRKGGRTTELHLAQFVSVTAGGYFFAPSIGALARLARTTSEFAEEETGVAYEEAYSELGELIFQENPYGSGGGWLLPGFQSVTEFDDDVRRWNFGGTDRRVVKAIRVPYRYRDEDGKVKTEHLLIGYQGGSGE